MSSSLIHQTCLDFERQIFAIVGPGAPATYAPTANQGSQYTDASNGNFYVMVGTTWTLMGASGGITQSFADGRYLQLTGGTLTGQLKDYPSIAGDVVLDVFNASTAASSGAVKGRVAADTNYTFAGASAANAITFSVTGAGAGYFAGTVSAANFAGNWSGYTNNLASGPFAGAPDSVVGLSGSTVQRYTSASVAAFLSTVTNGWTIGNPANVARINYGSASGVGFSFITGANGYADLYANALFVNDVHSSRSGTYGALYLGSNVDFWLYRHDNYFDIHFGATSNGYISMQTSSGTNGYLYSDSSPAVGFLDAAGGWSVRCTTSGGTLYNSWTVASRFGFNEYAQFNVPGISAICGYIGANQAAGGLINSTSQGELCFRSENRTMWWSVNAGSSAVMALDGNGLHVYSAINTSGPINAQGYAVPQIIYSSSAPSGPAPAGTIWLQY